ncbi:MAG: HIT domain-containing protein [Anaerolineales bacterium]|nr:HIT domain-containing protein [Anaerolineales bacterium]
MSTQPSCIFCKIIAGQAEASFVHKDDKVTAFMDIQPLVRGHLLIVPNYHTPNLTELADEYAGHMFKVGRRLAQALRASGLRCDGVNLYLADGVTAGQSVFHTHLHVIPRHIKDGFRIHFPESYGQRPPRATLDEDAEIIRSAVETT